MSAHAYWVTFYASAETKFSKCTSDKKSRTGTGAGENSNLGRSLGVECVIGMRFEIQLKAHLVPCVIRVLLNAYKVWPV